MTDPNAEPEPGTASGTGIEGEDLGPGLVDLAPVTTASVRARVPMAELPAFFDRVFGEVMGALQAQGVAVAGVPFGYYHGMPTDQVDVEAGIPTDRSIESSGDVVASSLPGGRVARIVHVGPYDAMQATYGRLLAWITEQGLTPADEMWECYTSDPSAEPDPGTWRTDIFWPVR